MTGPQRGDKITYVSPGLGELMHTTVKSRKGDTFFFAPCWDTGSRLSATDAQEHGVWVHGFLRWWRPSHRSRRKALLAAYALGDDRVQLTHYRTFEDAIEDAQRTLAGMRRRMEARNKKLIEDYRTRFLGRNRFSSHRR